MLDPTRPTWAVVPPCRYAELTARRYLLRLSIWLTGRAEPALPSTGRSSRLSTVLIVIFSDDVSALGTVVVHSGFRVQIPLSASLFLNYLAGGDLALTILTIESFRFRCCSSVSVDRCSSSVVRAKARCRITDSHLRAPQTRRVGEEPARWMRVACASSSWRAARRAGGRRKEAHHGASDVSPVSDRRRPVCQRVA